MQTRQKQQQNQSDDEALIVQELLALLAEKDRLLEQQSTLLDSHQKHLTDKDHLIREQQQTIELMEEQLRLATIRKYAASSEKMPWQGSLFDEAELEVALEALKEQCPDEEPAVRAKKKRQRGFSENLPRQQIYLQLPEEEKAGATRTFFSKVKEELEFIPAQVKVLEYWQEKAIFSRGDQDVMVAAPRPVHPLGKCFGSISLLAHLIVSKYADGLPLYRLEQQFRRYGADLDRSNMANWIIRLNEVFIPLMNLIRDTQREGDYLQADETRIQVLKEPGKPATSDKWMWVIRGGPPDRPAVIFEYDASRSGEVPARLLDGFQGILQADGYSGYNLACQKHNVTRIGCWDHARRKFVEAARVARPGKKVRKVSAGKADQAVVMIRQLYAIEKELNEKDNEEKKRARQEKSLPVLAEFKTWLEKNISRVLKGSQTHTAMTYTLNQWEYLTGYCDDGKLHISNALAENAIRPFAVGRRAWLFADTPQGARASATCYSLIETAKANGLEPHAYIRHVLASIGEAKTLEQLEDLLPWNVKLQHQ